MKEYSPVKVGSYYTFCWEWEDWTKSITQHSTDFKLFMDNLIKYKEDEKTLDDALEKYIKETLKDYIKQSAEEDYIEFAKDSYLIDFTKILKRVIYIIGELRIGGFVQTVLEVVIPDLFHSIMHIS